MYIKEQTKKEEGNGRERNIWWEIFPVLAEPTDPQDHPGYKWKHAKKKKKEMLFTEQLHFTSQF